MVGYDFTTLFYTDILSKPGSGFDDTAGLPQALKQSPFTTKRTQHREIVNPAFKIAVSKMGKPLAEKTIRLGESIEFNGNRLIFKDLTYWVKFYVGREHGLGVVYAGFTLMIIALIIRFMFFRCEVMGVAEGGKLHIAGRSEFYPALFVDEFNTIIKKLKGE